MSEEILKISDEDGVRTLTLSRPNRRNALSVDLVLAIKKSLQDAQSDDSVHVIVLEGEGKVFCAGGDLGPQAIGGMDRQQRDRLEFVQLLEAFSSVHKPTVAKVHGRALGGGFGLMLACDVTIAAESTKMGTPEVRVGLFPMMIMPLILRHMGRKATLELILTGGTMSAIEAYEKGCLTRVVPDEELDGAVEEMVAKLRRFSPAVHRLGLSHFHRMADLPLEPAMTLGADGLGLNVLLEDAAEGISAFLSKREPKWRGR
jgi:enoyl-CoA hydratase/carnithine racemase